MSKQHTNAIVIHETGAPDVLCWEQVPLPEPGPGQVLVRHTAVGFNMIDTYIRKGLYPAELPLVPGGEAAGVVEEVAGTDTGLAPGDRVAYVARPGTNGAYCERRVMNAGDLVRVPDGITDEQAAASLLKGLTAWVLLHRTWRLQAGETILVYAAAGGVGTILCQWAASIGARVIGVVGSDKKIAIARDNGCAEVINRSTMDIAATVRELTGGKGVPVVYDSLGKDTFEISLDCLQPTGLMVSYGNATGPVPPVNILDLMRRGSLFLTRPQFFHYIRDRQDLQQGVDALFKVITAGVVNIHIGSRFPLNQAREVHLAAESAGTIGATVMIP